MTTAAWEMEPLCRLLVFPREDRRIFWSHTRDAVPDSKKMDMPFVVAGTAKWVRDLGYETNDFFSCCWTQWQKHVLKDKTRRQVSPTQRHQSNGAVEKGRLHSARSWSHICGSSQRQKSRLLK